MNFLGLLLGKHRKHSNLSKGSENLRKLLDYARPQWRRLLTGLVLSIVAGFFNTLMLLSFQVIFSIVLKGDSPMLSKPIPLPFYGHFTFNEAFDLPKDGERASLPAVLIASTLIPMFIFLRGLLGFMATRSYLTAGSHILFSLRNDLYAAILRQSLSFFNRSKAGELIQIVSAQASGLQMSALALVNAITRHPAIILSTILAIFFIDPIFTLVSLLIFPLCIIPVRLIAKKMKESGKMEVGANTDMLVAMHEAFGGIRLVKGNSREDYELKRFEAGNRASSIDAVHFNKMADFSSSIVETVASLGIAVGLVYWWYLDKSAADFMLLVVALIGMYPPIKELSRIGIITHRTLAASEAVFDVLERVPDVVDKPDAVNLVHPKGAMSLRDVTFSYAGNTGAKLMPPALRGVSLDFEPGKFYALVGPSGSGKSTLFSLLLRYYDVDEGSITMDGHDIRDLTQKSLRENLSIVSQDTFLFHTTIQENIRYGRLDATDAEIVAAARNAHADDFIRDLHDGYLSVVGDAGSKVSGGQKQRIAIARTILKNAPVLLLDEATSALDTESERIIQEAIQTLSRGKTVIAIAHRLSTVLAAHKIIVMQEGRVVAVGSNEELLVSCPLYQKLHSLQFNSVEA